MRSILKEKRRLFILLSMAVIICICPVIIYANDITLATFIKTSAKTKYTCHITYDANGGIGTHTSTAIRLGEMDTVQALEDMGMKHSDYMFAGWNTQKDGSGITYFVGDRILLDRNLTLFAQWLDK